MVTAAELEHALQLFADYKHLEPEIESFFQKYAYSRPLSHACRVPSPCVIGGGIRLIGLPVSRAEPPKLDVGQNSENAARAVRRQVPPPGTYPLRCLPPKAPSLLST